jgi:hypothetical protein
MRMHHKKGPEVVVLSRAFQVHKDSNDKPVRLVGTHVDITERKRSEQFILTTSAILKMIATRESANDIYDAIARLYESRHPGLRCSMLILVGNKLMHAGEHQACQMNTVMRLMDWKMAPVSAHAGQPPIPGNVY